MKRKDNKALSLMFVMAFAVLTFLLWVPVYGSYGVTGRIMGLPDWAFYALIFAVVLFVLEWIYLFNSNLVIDDDGVVKLLEEFQEMKKIAEME